MVGSGRKRERPRTSQVRESRIRGRLRCVRGATREKGKKGQAGKGSTPLVTLMGNLRGDPIKTSGEVLSDAKA